MNTDINLPLCTDFTPTNSVPSCIHRMNVSCYYWTPVLSKLLLWRKAIRLYSRQVIVAATWPAHVNPIHVSVYEKPRCGVKVLQTLCLSEGRGGYFQTTAGLWRNAWIPEFSRLQPSSTPRHQFTHSSALHVSPSGWLSGPLDLIQTAEADDDDDVSFKMLLLHGKKNPTTIKIWLEWLCDN